MALTMGDLRRFVAESTFIPDDAPVIVELPDLRESDGHIWASFAPCEINSFCVMQISDELEVQIVLAQEGAADILNIVTILCYRRFSKNKKKLAETLNIAEAVTPDEVDPFEEAAELMDETVNTV